MPSCPLDYRRDRFSAGFIFHEMIRGWKSTVVLGFDRHRLQTAAVYFYPASIDRARALFASLGDILIDKYGEPRRRHYVTASAMLTWRFRGSDTLMTIHYLNDGSRWRVGIWYHSKRERKQMDRQRASEGRIGAGPTQLIDKF